MENRSLCDKIINIILYLFICFFSLSDRVLNQGSLSAMKFLWTMETKQLSITHGNSTPVQDCGL